MPVRSAASFAVRAAVIDFLKGVPELVEALDGDVNRIFEDVPADQPFPYLQVTSGDTIDTGATLHDGKNVSLTLHAYSRAEGSYEAENILQICYEMLRDAALDLSGDGHGLYLLHFLSGGVGGDPDGQSYHGVSNYRALTEEV